MASAGIASEWRLSGVVSGPRVVAAPGAFPAEALANGVAVALCTMSRPQSVVRFLESLANQDRRADQLVIVDASSGDETERAVSEFLATHVTASETEYVRVAGPLIGLTRQRNVGVSRARYDLVAFFDDDVVLRPDCVRKLEEVLRARADAVGAGAWIENEPARPGRLWRLRRILRIVPTLEPGRYARSGMSTPWSFLAAGDGVTPGDWLPGCAMMWRTAMARRVRFREEFTGYGQAEDLEFSLRAGREGALLMVEGARVLHEHSPAGRPDFFKLGYMAIRNRYWVHQGNLRGRRLTDTALFVYAWGLDTLLMARHLIYPRRVAGTLQQIAGRLRAGWDIVRGH